MSFSLSLFLGASPLFLGHSADGNAWLCSLKIEKPFGYLSFLSAPLCPARYSSFSSPSRLQRAERERDATGSGVAGKLQICPGEARSSNRREKGDFAGGSIESRALFLSACVNGQRTIRAALSSRCVFGA